MIIAKANIDVRIHDTGNAEAVLGGSSGMASDEVGRRGAHLDGLYVKCVSQKTD